MSNWRQNDDILMIHQGLPRHPRFWVEISKLSIKSPTAGGNVNGLGWSIIQSNLEIFMVLLLARHRVADAKQFLDGYNGPEASAVRERYGVSNDSVWATVQDNNDVLITHHFDTEEQANAFLQAPELKDAMEGLLEPTEKEVITGNIEVREVFKISKVGTVAGCMVVSGKIMRNSGVRLIREGVVVYTGVLDSLKRFKDDAKEVSKGYDCGMQIKNYNDIQLGDVFEAFQEVAVKKKL